MQLTKYVAAITISALSMFSTPVIAQTDKEDWTNFGKVHSGEILKLNERSVKFENMLVDDTINNQDGFYNDNDKFPKMKVVVFEYSINNKKRIAYTKSCNSGNLTANPYWKTYTSLIDNWPQYFRVDVDNVANQKMLQRVCTLSLEK